MRDRFVNSPWVVCPEPNDKATLRLFCFPYAGGSASVFYPWFNKLPREVEVLAIQLPGHGSRLIEPAFRQLPVLVQALADALVPFMDIQFAFWGHSMGALISFELARYLRWQHAPGPAHIFASGCSAPQLPRLNPPIHALPDEEFFLELHRLNGTPQEVFEHAELMQLLLPALRADFALCETYSYLPEPPLTCPLTVFGGLQDKDANRNRLEAWRQQSVSAFMLRMFPGDHFFIHTAQPLLLQTLSQDLQNLIN